MRTIDSIYSPYHTIEDKIVHTKHKKINKMLTCMYLPIERMHVTKLDDLDNVANMDHWYHKTWRKYYQYYLNVITNKPLSLDLATSSTHKSISQL